MRVLIDALSARSGGGLTYIRSMLPALVEHDRGNQYSVLLSPRYQEDLILETPEQVKTILANLPASPIVHRWWYLQTELPKLLRRGRYDLFYAVAEGSYLRMPCPTVMLIRNFSIYAPLRIYRGRMWHALAYRLSREPLVYLSMLKADRLVFVSETLRDHIVARFRVPLDKSHVVYHGVSPAFRVNTEHQPPATQHDRFLLAVSSLTPHKNYEMLITAFAQVVDNQHFADYRLTICGSIADNTTFERLNGLVNRLRLRKHVQFLGHLSSAELVELYRQASLFVFPSKLETFGQPLVEAMASGLPIIASDLPICREICDRAAIFLNPDDSDAWAKQIKDLLPNERRHHILADRGQVRSKLFSWDQTAREMIRIFEETVD